MNTSVKHGLGIYPTEVWSTCTPPDFFFVPLLILKVVLHIVKWNLILVASSVKKGSMLCLHCQSNRACHIMFIAIIPIS